MIAVMLTVHQPTDLLLRCMAAHCSPLFNSILPVLYLLITYTSIFLPIICPIAGVQPLIFSPNTTYYSSHFALKATITLDGKLHEPSNGSIIPDFGPVWSDICHMLQWYGAHQVGNLRAVPEILMEVEFTSDKALREFLLFKQKVETAMTEIMTKRFLSINPQASETIIGSQ